MDLRRRLVTFLGILLAGLVMVAMGIHVHSLHGDIAEEIRASEQLAHTLLAVGRIDPAVPPEEAARQLRAILGSAPLRHLHITLDGQPPAPSTGTAARLAGWFGIATQPTSGELVRVGIHALRIAPNPVSEIEERLGDGIRLFLTLLLFSGATLVVAWYSAHFALSPVRELEAGLHRLANGATHAELPGFRLLEFRRIAGAIDFLARALSESRAAQRQLSRQLMTVQEDERRQLARELHDEMGQSLTAIGVTAAYLERNAGILDAQRITQCAADLRQAVRSSHAQLRGLLRQLRPHGLDSQGLAAALDELVGSWQQREAGIDFRLDMPMPLPEVDESIALPLYRIVQEALTNVVRHSGARHCRVRITHAHGVLTLFIEDDGTGIPDDAQPPRGGLCGIAERVDMVGGRLEIRRAETGGVHLRVELPLTSAGVDNQ